MVGNIDSYSQENATSASNCERSSLIEISKICKFLEKIAINFLKYYHNPKTFIVVTIFISTLGPAFLLFHYVPLISSLTSS